LPSGLSDSPPFLGYPLISDFFAKIELRLALRMLDEAKSELQDSYEACYGFTASMPGETIKSSIFPPGAHSRIKL